MAISAQQSQLPLVRLPIGEAARPCVSGLVPQLCGAVHVVNIERANIAKAALNTFAAERFDKRDLPLPVARCLVNAPAVLVPVGSSAVGTAKTMGAFLAAVRTRLMAAPPRGKIAPLPAIMSVTFANAIGVHLVRLAAMSARALDWLLSHAVKIAHSVAEPKYFDIACKRIAAAVAEPRLPLEERRKPEQASLLEEVR